MMRVLVADDDACYRVLLKTALVKWGFQPVLASDGTMAWKLLQGDEAPRLAILDWMMPGQNGLELCRRLRADKKPIYIILLTANTEKTDIIHGLQNGADDYVTKPFDQDELYARLQVGVRVIDLQEALARRVQELECALTRVKQLSGLLPICCYCHSVRDDKNYWQSVEDYVAANADVRFSHGVCPGCYEKVVQPQLALFVGAAN